MERLAPARNYWLTTVTPSGAPHVVPVWGGVIDEDLYLYSERTTAKVKNLARDRRAAIHLESGDDVVIVHGDLEDVGHPSEVPALNAVLASKYDRDGDARYLPSSDPDFDVVYRLLPRRALLWVLADYEGSQMRWTADAR